MGEFVPTRVRTNSGARKFGGVKAYPTGERRPNRRETRLGKCRSRWNVGPEHTLVYRKRGPGGTTLGLIASECP